MTQYKDTDLFGGAITVSLPTAFADVSAIRDVPDNQEVHLSTTGLTSIIFDIVERAEPPEHPSCTTDAEALKYHFDDIVNSGYGVGSRAADIDEETKIWTTAEAVFQHLPDSPALTMLATQHPTSASPAAGTAPAPAHEPQAQTQSQKMPDFTGILLTLLRLPRLKTDILVAINVPHVSGEAGYAPEHIDLPGARYGALIEEAVGMRTEVLRSLRIVDWGLFGGDEE